MIRARLTLGKQAIPSGEFSPTTAKFLRSIALLFYPHFLGITLWKKSLQRG
jgi:hypothetical protein